MRIFGGCLVFIVIYFNTFFAVLKTEMTLKSGNKNNDESCIKVSGFPISHTFVKQMSFQFIDTLHWMNIIQQ